MKRVIEILLCLTIIFSTVGCTKTIQQEGKNANTTTTTTFKYEEDTTESLPEEKEINSESITEEDTKNQIESTTKKAIDEESGITANKSATSSSKVTETTTKVTPNVPKETTTEKAETTTKTSVVYADKSDEKAVAEKVIYYINKYRQEEGNVVAKKLPRMTEYAQYRSRQLVSNPHHSTKDERVAATALKYGEYIKPSLYGMSGDPYYQATCAEAVAGHGYKGTIDEVAKDIADLFRNSSGHWSYVGAVDYASDFEKTEYKYIGVGVTYENGYWYCCVCVTTTNQYG